MHKVFARAATIAALLVSILALPAAAQDQLAAARQAVSEADFPTADSLFTLIVPRNSKDKQLLIEAGDVKMELDAFGQARELYQRAVDADDDDANSYRKLAEAYSQLGDHPKAVETMRRAMKIDEKSLESYLALGRVYINAGRDSLSKAELTLLTANKQYPDQAATHIALGDLYFARKVYELAILEYEKALKIDSSIIEPRVKLGRAYRETAKRSDYDDAQRYYNQALQMFNKVTALSPKNARAWYEQGEILLLAEKWLEAGQSFNAYVKLRPEDPRGDIMLARAAYGGSYFKEGIAPLERIMTKTDSLSVAFQADARPMLAKSYYADKNYAKAMDLYSKLPASQLDSLGTVLYASSILVSGGDTSKAVALYKGMIAKNPSDCNLSSQLGNLLYKMKRYDEVIEVFNQRLINCPTEPKATPYLYMGFSYYSMKRYSEAAQAFTQSLAADSSNGQAAYFLMNAYQAAKQNDQAISAARRLIGMDNVEKENPKWTAQAYAVVGKARFDAKDYKGAIEQFERSTKLNPEAAQSYLFIAFSYQLSNDKENACKYYRLVLKYDPKNPDATKNMKALGC